MKIFTKNTLWLVLGVLLTASILQKVWVSFRTDKTAQQFISGNGRIEATEIDIAALMPGRVEKIYVAEGEFVKAGQLLATMETFNLKAQRDEAEARLEQAVQAVNVAEAEVSYRESEQDAAQRRVARSEILGKEGASSAQEVDDDRARARSTTAAVAAAKAQVNGARSVIKAITATIARIDTELKDCELRAPRDGRIQYLIAQPGEVLASGGKVLNLVDVSDVFMTFFLPETVAGKVAIGTDVHLVLDVAPDFIIPAKITFVASVAQFTPKTVETAIERQKLMFRVKATIDRELLKRYLEQVKTGLPGVAWVRLDSNAAWPSELTLKNPR